jgi:NAD/NADP transhydrogenase beta subunit
VAKRMAITDLPQMVAAFHSLVSACYAVSYRAYSWGPDRARRTDVQQAPLHVCNSCDVWCY